MVRRGSAPHVTPEAIRALDLQARNRYVYQRDPAGLDTWRSHADDALAGRSWAGDCDDLVSTVLDLAARQGVALDAMFRLLVVGRGTEGPEPNHMIGCLWDASGVPWVVGDTYGEACPAADCLHQVVRYQRLDDIKTWRQGTPWQKG